VLVVPEDLIGIGRAMVLSFGGTARDPVQFLLTLGDGPAGDCEDILRREWHIAGATHASDLLLDVHASQTKGVVGDASHPSPGGVTYAPASTVGAKELAVAVRASGFSANRSSSERSSE